MTITVTLTNGITSYTENQTTLLFPSATIAGTLGDGNKVDTVTVALNTDATTRSLTLNATATVTASTAGVAVNYSAGTLTLSGTNVADADWNIILRGRSVY